jgi:hypothetical protein
MAQEVPPIPELFFKPSNGARMTKPSEHCPKQGTTYLLRRNVKTGEIAIAWPTQTNLGSGSGSIA